MEKVFSKDKLESMNIDKKYGSNWIKFSSDYNNCKQDYKLHATGDCSVSSGRIYLALPSNIKITEEIIKKYNLSK